MARVCVVRQYYVPLDTRVRREVEALRSAGHDVSVVCLRGTGEPRRERSDGLSIIRLPLPHNRGGRAQYLFEYGAFLVMATLVVAALHLRRRFDLVQVNTMPDVLVLAAAVPKVLGVPVVLDLHECMPEFFASRFGAPVDGRAARLIGRVERLAIRFADLCLTCTDQMRDRFVQRGAPAEKVHVILNGADEEVFDPQRVRPAGDETDFRVMSHGSVEPGYGLDTAIRAVALLGDEIPGLRLALYGDGSQLDELHALAAELGVADRVEFSDGFVPLDDLVQAIADSTLGLVAVTGAYRQLTLCNKMYDFIAMRKPVVASRVRSVEEYFGQDSFVLFDGDDPADLAAAIRRVHREPELAGGLVERATAAGASHRWPVQRARYLELVDSALEGRRAT